MFPVGWTWHTVEVSLWNPVYALTPFILLAISIPLAILATFTTCIAIFVLFCRAFVVYIELTVALAGAWLDPNPPQKLPDARRSPSASSPVQANAPSRHRLFYRSNASSVSSQETIVPASVPARLTISTAMTNPSVNTDDLPRDYEGVGGWRTAGSDDEEALWIGMNSRLQLPGDKPARRQHRSLSGGNSPVQRRSWSPEASRTSAAPARVKTPVRFVLGDDGGYFPLQPMTSARRMSDATESTRLHRRKKSGSSSSGSGRNDANRSIVMVQQQQSMLPSGPV
ncbi:hypothetical protein ACEQ8H_006975 [Pleosporales sp. CAS-2024a]